MQFRKLKHFNYDVYACNHIFKISFVIAYLRKITSTLDKWNALIILFIAPFMKKSYSNCFSRLTQRLLGKSRQVVTVKFYVSFFYLVIPVPGWAMHMWLWSVFLLVNNRYISSVLRQNLENKFSSFAWKSEAGFGCLQKDTIFQASCVDLNDKNC